MARKTQRAEPTNFQLRPEGELTIYTASEFKSQLEAAFAQEKEIEINLSQVTEMDTAGLQLLILAKREAEARKASINLVAHSEVVRDVIDLCNMAAFFGDPVVIPSGVR